jgi:alpha-tubulin suppressor-like RCC1 family protein
MRSHLPLPFLAAGIVGIAIQTAPAQPFASQIVAWGDNSYGRTNVPVGLTNAIAIASGTYHSLALQADGKVVAWGNNGQGQGNVPADLTNAIAIAAGEYHSLAVRSDGSVVAWGRND